MSSSSESPKESREAQEAEQRNLGQDLWAAAHGENRSILEEAARRVRFIDFPDYPFPRFKQILYLVILDFATDDSDTEKRRKSKLGKVKLDLVRQTPEYQSIHRRFHEEIDNQRYPKTFAEHADDLGNQDKLARGLLRDSLHDMDGRVRTQAAKVLADRQMAPKREAQEMRHVFVRAEDLLRMTETERQMLEAGEDVIDSEAEELDGDTS